MNDTISCVVHKNVVGAIHYFDVADSYGASVIVEHENEAYYLSAPSAGDTSIKTVDQLKNKWAETVDAFLSRHPNFNPKLP